jgi:flagellar biosynthesis GTPase FlhF
MKKIFLILPLLIILAGVYAGRVMDDRVKNLLQILKLSETDAKSTIFSDISGPSFYFPNIKEFKSIATGERSSIVGVVGNYVKDYTASAEFKKQYAQYRETKKPTPPEKPKTMEQLKNEQRESIKNSLEEMRKSESTATADLKVVFQENIKYMEEQLKQLDDPNNTMYSPEMDTYMQTAYQQQLEQYNQQVSEWEVAYPKNNANLLIKNCLQSFLEQSKNVDFSAPTTLDQYGKTVFVKQEYERKSHFWKLCYRSGKETTEAARKFAQAWLSELK